MSAPRPDADDIARWHEPRPPSLEEVLSAVAAAVRALADALERAAANVVYRRKRVPPAGSKPRRGQPIKPRRQRPTVPTDT